MVNITKFGLVQNSSDKYGDQFHTTYEQKININFKKGQPVTDNIRKLKVKIRQNPIVLKWLSKPANTKIKQ